MHPVYAARVETACRLKKEGKVDMVVSLINAVYLLQQDLLYGSDNFVVQIC